MAHLFRLIAALLVWASLPAHAVIPTLGVWSYNGGQYGDPSSTGSPFGSAQAACDAYVAVKQAAVPSRTYQTGVLSTAASPPNVYGDFKCSTYYSDAGGGPYGPLEVGVFKASGGSCPANSTAVSGGCQCTSPYVENAGNTACEAPSCQSPLGTSLGGAGQQHTSAGYAGGLICMNGCSAAPASAGKVDGAWYAWGPFTSVGATCTGTVGGSGDTAGSEPPANPAPSPCQTGQCPGTVNGTSICVPCDTTKEDPPPKTDASTVTNADGSTTTTTTTTNTVNSCSGNSCNSTTTTTVVSGGQNADGTSKTPTTTTTTESEDSTRGDFCTDNPNNASCKDIEGTSFTGACSGIFKAKSDDAVVNAMAEEQHKRNCELFEKETEERTAYEEDKVKGKAQIDQSGDLKGNKTITFSPADFDASDALGGGACISDKTVTVFHKSVTLPFSRLCDFFGYMGTLLTIVGYLLGARILIRG